MALEEYKRKRDFKSTPEPGPKVEKKSKHRFVVQKHHASHLHFDFRLELDGVLISWAVPRGPSLDPADKRLAMHVEDHPVSYFDFEGTIPEGNYGAGTVMVWDVGTWEPMTQAAKGAPLMPAPNGDKDARAMMAHGDLKFRLRGKKLKGDWVIVKTRGRSGKGNEWLLIKKQDGTAVSGYDANAKEHDWSVLTKRSLDQIREDEGSRQWTSSRPAAKGVSKKAAWLADSIAKADKRKRAVGARLASPVKKKADADASGIGSIKGAHKATMPSTIKPMLATLVDEPFDGADWLFEVKFDGYRAVAFIDHGDMRLVSRNQNDMTRDFPEIGELPTHIRAKQAIVDGEICALDEQGRPSFSLMQQRTGFEPGRFKRRERNDTGATMVYYAFDLLYLDGYSLLNVDLEKRKALLKERLKADDTFRYSDHFPEQGKALYKVAQGKGLEGIVAKRRTSCYLQKRTREWLKIKLTQTQECVIGGYTDPRGSRENFGSIVLGLYDDRGRLIPVGQAGSGFTQRTHEEMWKRLQKLEVDKSPFHGKPDSTRGLHYVRPELVAEIKFTEWTHEGGTTKGGGLKMRAPVFQGLRLDKKPKDCHFELAKSAKSEARKAESGDAA